MMSTLKLRFFVSFVYADIKILIKFRAYDQKCYTSQVNDPKNSTDELSVSFLFFSLVSVLNSP